MKEEFVYCHLWWVDGLVWRLLCQESDFGPIRGLTVEEYETLKPKVEKLTVDSFAQTKKIWPNMTGPSKEEIDKQIDYVKTKFKDFEKHPEKLGKTTDDITFKEEDWWRPAKPNDKPFFPFWGRMWDFHHGFGYLSSGISGYPYAGPSAIGTLGQIHDRVIEVPEALRKEWEKDMRRWESLVMANPKKEVNDDDLMQQAIDLWKEDRQKMPKTMKIEVELTYPWCDHYPANDAAEFLKESVQDWLNANLSDGDNRLRLVSVSVKSDNMTYTTH